ncbi:MAG TPA: ester cyclase [Candidatus Angelobacter sp.]|nr:ester cyclase [Candidatus Angelobacter sp.]
MVAEGDKVAVRLSVTGTHQGGGLGFPATDRKINVTAITIIQFANGKLVQGWNNWDQLGMMQQLGMALGPVDMDQLLKKRA